MNMYVKKAVDCINDWVLTNYSKTFKDSYDVSFKIIGAQMGNTNGVDFIILNIEHSNGQKAQRPLSAFKYNDIVLRPDNIITVLNSTNQLDGKSTFDITDKINSWIKKNPYKLFVDKSGVSYSLIKAEPPDTLCLISKAGIQINKNISSLKFNKGVINKDNVYNILTQSTHINNQVFFGNIVEKINQWVKKNPEKWFQNGATGKFQILGAQSKNGITLLSLKNDLGIEKSISLNRLVYNNQNMNIGNAIEFLTTCNRFDNTIRFGDEIESTNEWLNKEKPTFVDKNGTPFQISKIFRDKDSQIKFQLTNLQGKTIERNAYSFSHRSLRIQDGNILLFLKSVRQFDNAVLFDNVWQQGKEQPSKEVPHFLPPFNSLDYNVGFRLPNGQCAKVIDIHSKQYTTSKQKIIDIIVEDGTIIRGISKTRYENGLLNLNPNRPILNILPTINNEHDDKTIRREMKQLASEKSSLGNRSNIEFKYFYYLQQLGFQVSTPLFFEQYFGIPEKRLPDSYLLLDKKMVIFEFDGGSGHGGVFRDISEDIEKDKNKNLMYQEIISNAKKGMYSPEIEDVMVVRVRGNNVPALKSKGICEIKPPKTSKEENMIPSVLNKMIPIIDKHLGLNLSKLYNQLFAPQISIHDDALKLNEFVYDMLNKQTNNTDIRIGEISQTIGFGNNEHRMGQYMMILKVMPMGGPPELDKVTVLFEDGRKIKTSYKKFKDGTPNDNKFNKLIDFSKRKAETITVSQLKKQTNCAYSISYCDDSAVPQALKNDITMSLEEIMNIRENYPINNGIICQKNISLDMSVADMVFSDNPLSITPSFKPTSPDFIFTDISDR